MRTLFIATICLFAISGVQASDEDEVQMMGGERLDETLKKDAKSRLESSEDIVVDPDKFVYPYYFEIKDTTDQIRAKLNLTRGPFSLDLVKTVQNDKKTKVVYVKDSKNQVNVFETSYLNETTPTTSAVLTETGENGTQVELTFTYTGMTGGKTFKVESAEIKMTVQLGGPTKIDYWNVTTASLSVNSTVNGTEANMTVNLTPQFGYTKNPSDFACTTGFGICAPMGLCWSCNDQIMKPNDLSAVGADKLTLFLHFPGMVFDPAVKGNSTTGFGFNWDCDPLIPVSLWASLLLTLLMATILFYALYMLSALQTPNKFDDPKGPSIHVPQTE